MCEVLNCEIRLAAFPHMTGWLMGLRGLLEGVDLSIFSIFFPLSELRQVYLSVLLLFHCSLASFV